MVELDVHVETLKPMRVAWVRAVGRSPEEDSWRLLSSWAQPAGLLEDPIAHPVFGFNNPSPGPGQEEYGYEFWIAVDPDTRPPEGIGLKDFEGGLFAVTSCRLAGGGAEVPTTWRALLRWVDRSRYRWRRTEHELERVPNPLAPVADRVLDLCLPIED